MKLVDLVHYFKNDGSYEEFCRSQSLELESEVIEVYMEKPFDLNKEIAFFEIEKTEGKVEYHFKEMKYFNLFDFYYFLDTIEESKNSENKTLTDIQIANVLLTYGRDDA
ncbi:hypothetical protein SAMN05428949_0652 [Chitinophaga sp. YR627]|uniref:hypothetical protein n=1 Tax=Chitinophaga sp. YR627 TaxID=1881041 RepID=UPI0008EDA1B0|nr:hypothetical protein [Chitinophaga sp. YR627]SFM74799.1 hypothetical protein SAMN05428949_0652 [Chitinophaga sp. YR627]